MTEEECKHEMIVWDHTSSEPRSIEEWLIALCTKCNKQFLDNDHIDQAITQRTLALLKAEIDVNDLTQKIFDEADNELMTNGVALSGEQTEILHDAIERLLIIELDHIFKEMMK